MHHTSIRATYDGDILGCVTERGACGKDEITADLQDLLIYQIRGIAQYTHRARASGVIDRETDDFILFGLFSTLTNVNFTATRFNTLIQQAAVRDSIKAKYEEAASASGEILSGPASYQPASDQIGLLQQAASAQVNADHETIGEEVAGLRFLALYGMKGVAAYCHHARVLGQQDNSVDAEIERILDYLASDPTDIEEILGECLAIGELNTRVMALLDTANTGTCGPVGWPGVHPIDNGNFAHVIQAAKALPGFKEDAQEKTITTGFGHHTVRPPPFYCRSWPRA